MSYTELAEARRITTSSAVRLVLRRGWRRQQDNQGIMRALVPQKWTEPAMTGQFSEVILALETTVVALRERAETAERIAESERERANRAEVARRAELSRGNFLRDRIDLLRTDLAEAEAALEAAHNEALHAVQLAESLREAEARRRALGPWARIWQAWKG